MRKCCLTWISFLSWMLFSMTVQAAVPSWKIAPAGSTMTFTAIQNDAPVEGKFTQFEGDLQFDPNQLKDSKAVIKVKTDSVSTPLKDIATTLKDTDWLSAKTFPEAIFQAVDFEKKDNEHYLVHGNLTIRDKTFPVTVNFSLTNYSPEKASIKGSMMFKRTPWGLGQGEWADLKAIKDDIQVNFVFELIPNK